MRRETVRVGARVAAAAVVIGIGLVVRQGIVDTGAPGWVAAGYLFSALMLLRLALALRRAHKRLRRQASRMQHATALEHADVLAASSLPPWVRGFYAMEKRAYRGAWRTVRRVAVTAAPFAIHSGPLGRMRMASQLLTVLLCSAALGYWLAHLTLPARAWWGAGVALVLATSYALVWIVGERRSLREGGHRIEGALLHLDAGLRASAAVPLTAIDSCAAIGGHSGAGGRWRITSGEAANVLLVLAHPADAVIRGRRRRMPAGRVLVYADAPASFVAAVNRAVIAARQRTQTSRQTST